MGGNSLGVCGLGGRFFFTEFADPQRSSLQSRAFNFRRTWDGSLLQPFRGSYYEAMCSRTSLCFPATSGFTCFCSLFR